MFVIWNALFVLSLCLMSLTYKQLLAGNRHFRNLWLGQVVSELGNWFNFIAALGLARVVSHASPEVATILLLMRTAPFSLCALVAGALILKFSRKTVLIVSDLLRAAVALGFLLAGKPENLWIAYVCMGLLSAFGAFFEAAKNAALPNVTGENGLLAGNALMFSSRFLLMSLGAALGGWATTFFGYQSAFIINAVSFLVSAFSVWLVPAREMYQPNEKQILVEENQASKRPSVFSDIVEGWSYIRREPLVLTIICVNIVWAIGGGAINLVVERLGGVVFAERGVWAPDAAVALLYTATGAGLFIGMMIAHRTDAFVTRHRIIVPFIGWMLVLQGVLYGIAGNMPSLWLVAAFMLVSRVILGVEYAIQETIFVRTIPDALRGRVLTSDRAAEISVFSLSSVLAGWSLSVISPQTLTLISGFVSSLAGIFWFIRVSDNTNNPQTITKEQLLDEPSESAATT